ncbi:MAG: hypothetical protein LQ342_004425 [Letrouitia transgressa]|nr:MAG: hypothetical protein LQ342_004425 [Letrouitia transgressa]
MHISSHKYVIASLVFDLIATTSSTAVRRASVGPGFSKRQDDVGALSTEPIRKCKPPDDVYKGQDTVDWYEMNRKDHQLEVTKTTKKNEAAPKPDDTEQGNIFNVDHIFELQVLAWAFDDKNRKVNNDASAISDGAWKKVQDAINDNNAHQSCQDLAGKITVLQNLRGVSQRINFCKEAIFIKVTSGDKNSDLNPKWDTDYLESVYNYLVDASSGVDSTISDVGKELDNIAGENVSKYFNAFAKDTYKAGQDYALGQMDKAGAATASPSATAAPPPTTTSAPEPTGTTCNCNENGCTDDSPGCCANGTCPWQTVTASAP